MGSCHRAELGQMKRRYWSLSVGLLLGLLLVAPHAAHAEGGTWPPVGQLAGGTPGDVAVQGDYAYVAAEAAFTVIDISDPAFPAQVGSWDTPGIAFGVAAAGAYAYVADAEEGLRVIDISDPAAPVEVGSWDTPGCAHGVAVAGGYAYVADGYGGLRVIDISDPAAPMEVGSCDTPDAAWGVAVAGGYAYMADGYGGLRVIDISDPAAPVKVGSLGTLTWALSVAVAEGYAYVADGDAGVRVIDISDPAAPVEVGFWDTPGEAQGVAVAGGYVYLADCGWGLVIFPEYGNGGPQADFAASLASGEAPLTVEFTDLSTHSPTSWSWRFGDDGTSTAQHPSHTYTSEGTYTVSLTVSNAGGSDTVSVLSGLGTPVSRPV